MKKSLISTGCAMFCAVLFSFKKELRSNSNLDLNEKTIVRANESVSIWMTTTDKNSISGWEAFSLKLIITKSNHQTLRQ